jgi:hypothetical protein
MVFYSLYHRPGPGATGAAGDGVQLSTRCDIAQIVLGFAPEDSGVFGNLTAAENIALAT